MKFCFKLKLKTCYPNKLWHECNSGHGNVNLLFVTCSKFSYIVDVMLHIDNRIFYLKMDRDGQTFHSK